MTTSKNRSINTRNNNGEIDSQMITLEVIHDTKHNGSEVKAGETITVSKSEAKRLIAVAKSSYRIKDNL